MCIFLAFTSAPPPQRKESELYLTLNPPQPASHKLKPMMKGYPWNNSPSLAWLSSSHPVGPNDIMRNILTNRSLLEQLQNLTCHCLPLLSVSFRATNCSDVYFYFYAFHPTASHTIHGTAVTVSHLVLSNATANKQERQNQPSRQSIFYKTVISFEIFQIWDQFLKKRKRNFENKNLLLHA